MVGGKSTADLHFDVSFVFVGVLTIGVQHHDTDRLTAEARFKLNWPSYLNTNELPHLKLLTFLQSSHWLETKGNWQTARAAMFKLKFTPAFKKSSTAGPASSGNWNESLLVDPLTEISVRYPVQSSNPLGIEGTSIMESGACELCCSGLLEASFHCNYIVFKQRRPWVTGDSVRKAISTAF